MRKLRLNNGTEMPQMGFGVSRSQIRSSVKKVF